MNNLSQMLKQAQGMQTKMEEMQTALEALEVEGVASGGLVKLTLTGKGVLRRIRIDPSLLAGGESEDLEDLIAAAHQDAKAKVDQISKDRMADVTGGLALPPGMKLPF